MVGSKEYRDNLVKRFYDQYLDRTGATAPSQQEVDFWSGQLAQGLTDEGLLAVFITSDDYFQLNGLTYVSWLKSLYSKLLNRVEDPTAFDQGGFSAHLATLFNSFGGGRQGVISSVVFNDEFRSKLVYDPATDVWSLLGYLPAARRAMTACLIGDQIFATGGFNSGVQYTTAWLCKPVV